MIPEKLQLLRDELDILDNEITEKLSRRFLITKKIWQVKKRNELPKHDPMREQEKLAEISKVAVKHNLSPDITKNIFEKIMGETRSTYID